MSRLDELQDEFVKRHQNADVLECHLAPPEGNSKVMFAVYFSPEYKAEEGIREFFRMVVEEELRRAGASG